MKRKTLLLIVAMLALAICLCGCGANDNQTQSPADNSTAGQASDQNAIANDLPATQDTDNPANPPADGNSNTEAKDDPVSDEGKNDQPADNQAPDDGKLTCTISISCATLLDNIDLCAPDKVELIPADGWVLKAQTVEFFAGENVFNVLQRVCKENRVHLEFMNTPLYNSAYIEGMHNLYEFDAGELSGWMYSVNGWFPNYGCSRYELKDGDTIAWVFTCNLGKDVGGEYASGNNSAE